MTAYTLQNPSNVRDRLSYAELELKFIQSCEAVSESGKELEKWYSFLMKELCDVQLDRVKEQLRETALELENCKAKHLEEIKQMKLELQQCQNKSNTEINMLKSQLEVRDMVTAEEDYLQRGDLSSLSILSQPAHSIVVVDAPDNSSSDGLISSSFDAERCWPTSNQQEEAWMDTLRKRSRHHKCSQRCKLAKRSGSSTKPNARGEILLNDTRPHVVVIDSLSSSSGDGHFQRKSNRIWDKKNSQRSDQPEIPRTRTKRGRAQDKLHKQQRSSPRHPRNPIPKTQPCSVVINKMSKKDILDAKSNSTSSSAESITLKATRKTARAKTARSKRRKSLAKGRGVRKGAAGVTGVGVQKKQQTGQTTSHAPSLFNSSSSDNLIDGMRRSGGDHVGREISCEISPKKSVTDNLISSCSPEDLVPVREVHKTHARVISDTIEEIPSIMDTYSDTPSTFSLDDSGPLRGRHKKCAHIIDDTLEEVPREMTTSELAVDPVCPRLQRDALSLEEEELLEERLGKDNGHPAHQSAEELPKGRENVESERTKTSETDSHQGLQGANTSVVFDAITNATNAPSKKPKGKKETLKELVWRSTPHLKDEDITAPALTSQKTLAHLTEPPSRTETVSKPLSPRNKVYGDLDKTHACSIVSHMSLSDANSTFAQLVRRRKKTSHRRLSSTFLTDTFTDDDEVKSKKGTAIKVNTTRFLAPRLKLSQREKSYF